jgi:peptidoglycan/xylan/chitin deacetylase (PgdA/CDA1 family)
LKRLLKLAISIAYFLCFLPLDLIARLLGSGRASKCVVLYYHAIPSAQRVRFCRQMNLLLRWSRAVPANISKPAKPGKRSAAVTFDDGFLTVVRNALPELQKRHIPCTVFIMTDYLGKPPPWAVEYSEGDPLDRIVTLEELVKMPSDLVVIGSHTVTHPDLTTLGQKQALDELVESRRSLENWLGREVRLLSFPYGAYNGNLVGLCREAGYSRVFTSLPKLAFADPEEYATGRVPVDLSDWDIEFVLKLFGAYRWLPYAFSLKRAIRSVLGFRHGKNNSGVPHD